MRFTCTLAAFLVAAAAAASIVGAAPLPDVDSGQAEVRARRAGDHCPRDFPFPTHGPAPLAGNICYNDADSAKKGTGNCGTWCTKDVTVGTGCGGNQDRICSDDEDRTSYPITYAYHLASQSCSAGENHVISQADCIGAGTNSYQAHTSKVLDFLKSRGEANRIDNFPIRNCGKHGGANAKGCWTNGDSLIYVTGEPDVGTSCDAVEVHSQIGPVCAATMRDGDKISLKSWKGDYLHRPDSAQGVTSYVTSQADCIGDGTNSYQATTSKMLDFLKSRGEANRIDNFPIRKCGELVGANAKGCWTNGDSLVYVTGEPGTKSCDAVEMDTRVWPVSSGIGNEWTVEVLASGKISLKSWKGDYLHRPDSAQGVTTSPWSAGIGNEWTLEEPIYKSDGAVATYDSMANMCTADGSSLCSVDQVCPDGDAYTAPIGGTQDFGDMWLPVVDAAQPGGKQWVQVGRRAGGTCNRLTAYHGANLAGYWMETTQRVPYKQMYACCNGKISLKSWKDDSLHRPNSAQGVTTWSSGIGNEWTVDLLTSALDLPFKVVEGRQFCQMTSDNCVTDGLGAHNNNEQCVIQVQQSGVLTTPEFDVESHGQCDWDSVEVGGTRYCGTDGPVGVNVSAHRAGDEDRTGYPITYAYSLGSQSCSAGENHVISKADCIGDGTNSHQGTTSKVLEFLKSRGGANRIDNFPIRGELAGANAEGCWTNGDSLIYVTGGLGTTSLDARVGPVCAGIMHDTITWTSDFSVTRSGWTICLNEEAALNVGDAAQPEAAAASQSCSAEVAASQYDCIGDSTDSYQATTSKVLRLLQSRESNKANRIDSKPIRKCGEIRGANAKGCWANGDKLFYVTGDSGEGCVSQGSSGTCPVSVMNADVGSTEIELDDVAVIAGGEAVFIYEKVTLPEGLGSVWQLAEENEAVATSRQRRGTRKKAIKFKKPLQQKYFKKITKIVVGRPDGHSNNYSG